MQKLDVLTLVGPKFSRFRRGKKTSKGDSVAPRGKGLNQGVWKGVKELA